MPYRFKLCLEFDPPMNSSSYAYSLTGKATQRSLSPPQLRPKASMEMPGAEKVGVTVCSSQAKPSEWRRWVSLDYSSAITLDMRGISLPLISFPFSFCRVSALSSSPTGSSQSRSLTSVAISVLPLCAQNAEGVQVFPLFYLILLLSFLHFSLGSNCQVQVNPQ